MKIKDAAINSHGQLLLPNPVSRLSLKIGAANAAPIYRVINHNQKGGCYQRILLR